MRNEKRTLDAKTIAAVEAVLSRGDRAELIPVKDGVRVFRVRREEAGDTISKRTPA